MISTVLGDLCPTVRRKASTDYGLTFWLIGAKGPSMTLIVSLDAEKTVDRVGGTIEICSLDGIFVVGTSTKILNHLFWPVVLDLTYFLLQRKKALCMQGPRQLLLPFTFTLELVACSVCQSTLVKGRGRGRGWSRLGIEYKRGTHSADMPYYFCQIPTLLFSTLYNSSSSINLESFCDIE